MVARVLEDLVESGRCQRGLWEWARKLFVCLRDGCLFGGNFCVAVWIRSGTERVSFSGLQYTMK